jgi:hypothetical protein
MPLDKIRLCESTKTASKRPCSRRWVYQCRCWFALASGYDWSSLGGEGKVTWTVIANKSRVEKQKKFCTEQWFFLVNFLTVATNCFWGNWEFFLIVRIREKNDKKMEKIDNIYKPQNWKKRRRKKNTGKEVYICVCTLNNVWKNMFVKLMMFCCKTLLTPYVENHNQHDWHLVQTFWIWDLRP